MNWTAYPALSDEGKALGTEVKNHPAQAVEMLTEALNSLATAYTPGMYDTKENAQALLRTYQRGLAAAGVVRDAVLRRHQAATSLLMARSRELIFPDGVGLGVLSATLPALTAARWVRGELASNPHTGPEPQGHAAEVAVLREHLQEATRYRLREARE